MDLLLENGDLKRDSAGKPIEISGLEELRQRVYIRLRPKPGVFVYDRELGSEASMLSESSTAGEILECVRNALPELFDAELVSAGCTGGSFTADFRSRFGDFAVTIPLEKEE